MTNLCKNNVTTSLSKNLDNISNDSNVTVDNLTKNIVKNSLKYAEIPEDGQLRVPIANELLNLNNDQFHGEVFYDEEIKDIITFLCSY